MKAIVKRTCGHLELVYVDGSAADRTRELRYQATKRCRECEHASVIEESEGLPELIGSEAQVAWAMAVRLRYIELWVAAVEEGYGPVFRELPYMTEEAIAIADEVIDAVSNELFDQTAARWWIDHRYDTKTDMMLALGDRMQALYVERGGE